MATLFMGEGFGRPIIIHLKRGDLLLESIRDLLAKEGVKNAVLFGAVGSMRKLVYHLPTSTGPTSDDRFITVEGNGPIELAPCRGTSLTATPIFTSSPRTQKALMSATWRKAPKCCSWRKLSSPKSKTRASIA